MNISFIGSHGTGKSTTISALKDMRPQWGYYSEATRHLVEQLGFQNAYDFVNEYGIAAYELIFISHWSWLDPDYSSLLKYPFTIIDRSPIDNLGYYFLLRSDYELKYEPILLKLTEYYIKYIDYYMLFPPGRFTFKPDQMQREELQTELHSIINNLLAKFNLPHHIIQENDINLRAVEAIKTIESLK